MAITQHSSVSEKAMDFMMMDRMDFCSFVVLQRGHAYTQGFDTDEMDFSSFVFCRVFGESGVYVLYKSVF